MAMFSMRALSALLLLLFVVSLSFRFARSQASTSRSSSTRREASDTDDDTTYIGHTNRAKALELVCEKALQAAADMYENNERLWEDDNMEDIDNFAFGIGSVKKPIITPKYSVCAGLETTCCNPRAERGFTNIVPKDYRLHFHDVLYRTHSRFCRTSPGKTLYRAMQANLREVRRQLEIEANQAAEMELPNNTFSDLFSYLINFSIDPDICPVPTIISSLVENIVQTVFMSFLEEDDSVFGNVTAPEERRICLMNATKPFTQTDTSILTSFLGRLLYDYRELVKSVYFAEKVIEKMKLHMFSPSCNSALARLKYCAICGGYTDHPPCLNLCMNTFRGCFADVAEVHVEFKILLTLLREHTIDVLPNLQTEAMREGLSNFVSLIRQMTTSEHQLRAAVLAECGDPTVDPNDDDVLDELDSLRRRRRRQDYYQPINPVPVSRFTSVLEIPEEARLGLDPLSTAFSEELQCLDLFEGVIGAIPEQMCYLDKEKVSSLSNVNCWAGSYHVAKERYEESVVGPMKADQGNNSAFELHPIEPGILYTDLILKIQDRIIEVNETIVENERCRESDDEDQCTRDLFHGCVYATSKPKCDNPSDCGSGSESGSGSGSGSGFYFQDDTESGPTEFTFGEEQTTSNTNDGNYGDQETDNTKMDLLRRTHSNHFNDAPAAGNSIYGLKTTTVGEAPDTTESYAKGTMGVINIDPDGEEKEDTDVDSTPMRTRLTTKPPEKVENVKDFEDGRSGSCVMSVAPAMAIVLALVSVVLVNAH